MIITGHCAVQALSKALLDLRADMVSQAQSEVLANAEQAAAEINVQRLVEKRTKELQVWYTISQPSPMLSAMDALIQVAAVGAVDSMFSRV